VGKQAIITVDPGFGDSGKRAWVDFLTREYRSDLTIRYSGGSQCGHNVQLPDGRRHTFSQYVAGTFAGAKTYLGPQTIGNPYALEKEKTALCENGG
jgi:adenylosuccinate synthase